MRITHFIWLLVTYLTTFACLGQVQSPKDFLGYELGSQFSRHHQVVDYYQHVADQSDELALSQYGATYEKRPLYLAYLSTAENLERLDQIKDDNLKRAGLLEGTPETDVVIVWLSYNVHGNESVSTEASMATVFELLNISRNQKDFFANMVVIIDPCLNPDGRERYVNFYYEKGQIPFNPNSDAWEHNEPWPGGRANHYLFDLNRDWAWLSQIESQQRIAVYNEWLPQIHVDFHEQDVNEPYYFAPAAKPYHNQITKWQTDFQVEIGKANAERFDAQGWLYFTKKYFDLLYPSYGDTYPTYNGSIGMTYEQGGSGRAGLGVITEVGDTLTLADRIAHHTATGLSTVQVAYDNRSRLLSEFKDYFKESANSVYKSYVLKHEGDDRKFSDLKGYLDKHNIVYGKAEASKKSTGYHYKTAKTESFDVSSKDLIISTNQPKSKLVTILFEPVTALEDSLTYDITAWSLPYVYNMDAYASKTLITSSKVVPEQLAAKSALEPDAYAYIFNWSNMADAKMLAELLKKDIKVRFTHKPLSIGGQAFSSGSIIVLRADNPNKDLSIKVGAAAQKFGVVVTSVNSGWASEGPDLGADDVRYLKAPKVALLGGSGASSLDYGATWHYFEQELGYPITTLSLDYFSRIDLDSYDVLILQNGGYGVLDADDIDLILAWVKSGGKLIAVQGAIGKITEEGGLSISKFNSTEEQELFEASEAKKKEDNKLLPETSRERKSLEDYVAGAIFKVSIDNTHPLGFGYTKDYYSLKTSTHRLGLLDQGNVGVILSEKDHLSGFAGQDVKSKVANSLVFGVENYGNGQVVYMIDNPLFRSFWYGGELLFANAVFFVGE